MQGTAIEWREARRKLEEVGFDPNQAEALVEMVSNREQQLATRDDVAVLRGEMRAGNDSLRTEFNARIDALDISVSARLEALSSELTGRMTALEGSLTGRMDGLGSQLTTIKWFLGAMIAVMVPATVALVRLAFM